MFSLPSKLITYYYYDLLHIKKDTSHNICLEKLRHMYLNYHKTELDLDNLYNKLLDLSIVFNLLNDNSLKMMYDTYGDYILNKLIVREHFNNKILNLHMKKECIHYIHLEINDLQSGTKIYKEGIEINIPKNSKVNDIISIKKNEKDIHFVLQLSTKFIVCGYNLLTIVPISMYDILLNTTYEFVNIYDKKINISLNSIQYLEFFSVNNSGMMKNNTHQYIYFSIEKSHVRSIDNTFNNLDWCLLLDKLLASSIVSYEEQMNINKLIEQVNDSIKEKSIQKKNCIKQLIFNLIKT